MGDAVMATTLSLFREAMQSKGWKAHTDAFGYIHDIRMEKDLRHVLNPAQRLYLLEQNFHGHDWFPKAGFNVSHINFEILILHHNGQGMWRKDGPTETEARLLTWLAGQSEPVAVDMHRATQQRISQLLQTAYEQACVEANQIWDRYMKVPKDWNGWTTE
jgi:hypothetical protein